MAGEGGPSASGASAAPDAGAARAALAAEQARLVRALTAGGPVPDGFDPDRLARSARSLLNKRRRSMARAWPGLPAALGEQFAPLFAAYAEATPLPSGGPGDDGRGFAEWLDRTGRLPDPARLDLMLARCRRGSPVRVELLRKPLRLVVAVRVPRMGVRWRVVRIGTGKQGNAPGEG